MNNPNNNDQPKLKPSQKRAASLILERPVKDSRRSIQQPHSTFQYSASSSRNQYQPERTTTLQPNSLVQLNRANATPAPAPPPVPIGTTDLSKECPRCTYHNDVGNEICELCETSLYIPPNLQSRHNLGPSSRTISQMVPMTPTILATVASTTEKACSTCTFLNPLDSTVCEICEAKFPVFPRARSTRQSAAQLQKQIGQEPDTINPKVEQLRPQQRQQQQHQQHQQPQPLPPQQPLPPVQPRQKQPQHNQLFPSIQPLHRDLSNPNHHFNLPQKQPIKAQEKPIKAQEKPIKAQEKPIKSQEVLESQLQDAIDFDFITASALERKYSGFITQSDLQVLSNSSIAVEDFECPTCFVDIEVNLDQVDASSPASFFKSCNGLRLAGCGCVICMDCLGASIDTQANVASVVDKDRGKLIGCPNPNCPKHTSTNTCPLSTPLISLFISRDRLQAFEGSTLHSDTLYKCLTPNCTFAAEIENLEIFLCPKCSVEQCTKCRTKSHPKSSCSDNYAKSHASDLSIKDIKDKKLQKQLRQCPNCKTLLTKQPNSCNKFQCQCGYGFCWRCGTPGATCNCTPKNHAFWNNKNVAGNGASGVGGATMDILVKVEDWRQSKDNQDDSSDDDK